MSTGVDPRGSAAARPTESGIAVRDVGEVTVGLVGCTGVGRTWAEILTELGVRRLLCFDDDRDMARALAQQCGGEAFGMLEGLLARGPVGVAIAAPAQLRPKPAQLALEAGAHVLVQHPVAPRLDGARSIADFAAARGITIFHPFAQLPMLDAALERVAAGALGELVSIRHVWARRATADGLLEQHFPHAIAALGTLVPLERVESVSLQSGACHHVLRAWSGSVRASALIQFDRSLPTAEHGRLVVEGLHARLRVPLHAADAGARPSIRAIDTSGTPEELLDPVVTVAEARRRELRAWLTVLSGGSDGPAVDARHGLRIQAVWDAAMASAGDGREIVPERV